MIDVLMERFAGAGKQSVEGEGMQLTIDIHRDTYEQAIAGVHAESNAHARVEPRGHSYYWNEEALTSWVQAKFAPDEGDAS